VATGEGILRLRKLQRPGGRLLPAAEFSPRIPRRRRHASAVPGHELTRQPRSIPLKPDARIVFQSRGLFACFCPGFFQCYAAYAGRHSLFFTGLPGRLAVLFSRLAPRGGQRTAPLVRRPSSWPAYAIRRALLSQRLGTHASAVSSLDART